MGEGAAQSDRAGANWWRFLPADDAAPTVAEIVAAAGAGHGALSRMLREARHRLGAIRASARLGSAERGAGHRFGHRRTLLLVTAQQASSVSDALHLGFAIAGFALDIRAVEGLPMLAAALEDEGSTLFDGIDLALFAVPGMVGTFGLTEAVAALADAVSRRSLAPVAVARFEAGGDETDADRPGVETLRLGLAAGDVVDTRFTATFGGMPTAAAADRLADAAAGFATRQAGSAPKLVVTDLDQTLWSGILGEDGVPKLHLRYSMALKELARRGFVLAAASRNDPADVAAAFAALGSDELTAGDFSAMAIGWSDKAALVADVLATLGLAQEHAVFIDDDAVNCAKVAARFPGMDVRRFSGDPGRFAQDLLADPLLAGSPDITTDRALLYARRDAAERLRGASTDVASFLERLGSRVTIRPLGPDLLPRAAELAARVNQFRFTALRPGVAELASRGSRLDFMAGLGDAFGAHGLVGLVLASESGEDAVIDAFCLSCRALERGVEGAMLQALVRKARDLGLKRLVGRIETLPRNEPARDALSRYGFGRKEDVWVLDLADAPPNPPEGVTLILHDLPGAAQI